VAAQGTDPKTRPLRYVNFFCCPGVSKNFSITYEFVGAIPGSRNRARSFPASGTLTGPIFLAAICDLRVARGLSPI
jgi:hypothetical protein